MSDWHLVERAQNGDMAAFAELYTMHSDKVHIFVRYRVGLAQHALAEDIAAEAWTRALRALPRATYQGVSYEALVKTIARNLVFDHSKSHRHLREIGTDDIYAFDRPDMPERQTEALAVGHIASVEVLAALKQLTAEQRDVIVLRYLRGLEVAETAQAMGRTDDAVKALQYRAIGALRRLLTVAGR